MRILIELGNRIESIYKKRPQMWTFIFRVIFSFMIFLILRQNTGYNTFLSYIALISLISLVCGFIPSRGLTLVYLAYLAIHIFTLSAGIGAATAAILLVMFLLYFRLEPGMGYVVALSTATSMIRMPLLIPLVLAATTPPLSLLAVFFGTVVYYMIRYINMNAAVFSALTDTTEITKAGIFLTGFFTYREFWYMAAAITVVFLVVYYIKKARMNNATNFAVAVGTGLYMILTITANLLFQTITAERLIYIVAGSVASMIIAFIAVNVIRPLDFSRVREMEFEDEEYYYYVRAVPKATINRETVDVKRINRRPSPGEPKKKGDNR